MKRIFWSMSAVLMILSFLMGTASAAAAATTPSAAPTPANTSTGLSINPRKNLIVDDGQTVNDKLIISNLDQAGSLDITIRVIDFTYENNSGTPKLFLGPNIPQTTWSLRPFLTIPKTVLLGPGQTQEIPYSVKIPAKQGAGSYYSAIEYSASPGSGPGNVSLNASGVTLMFVTVPGSVHENLTLQKLGAYQQSTTVATGSYLFVSTGIPQEIGYTLKNNGDVTESPSGSMTINYMFGGKPIIISNVNVNNALALIGQSRLFQTCITPVKQIVIINGSQTASNICGQPKLKPGRYTVTLGAYYGQNGNPTQEVQGTASFWYLPWWFIASVLACLVVLVAVIWFIVRRIRIMLYGNKPRSKRFQRRV